jgi:hypothetical protein
LIIDQGDPEFDQLFQELVVVRTGNWALLYRHLETGDLWDVTYPQGEMHGGGPKRLRRLTHRDPEKWEPYPEAS